MVLDKMVSSTAGDRGPSILDPKTLEGNLKPGLRIYIAGFFDTRERLYPVRDTLNTMGHEVTSTWLDEQQNDKAPGEVSKTIAEAMKKYEGTTSADYLGYAVRDLADIDRSDLVAVDTADITPRGGREVEVGYALGTGKHVVVVGPQRNVFHMLAVEVFPTWEDAYNYFRSISR